MGPLGWAWPTQRQPFYQCQTETERSDSEVWNKKSSVMHRSIHSIILLIDDLDYTLKCLLNTWTYGSASIMGSAFSWIFEGLLKPISYTPLSSWGFLIQVKKNMRDELIFTNISYVNVHTWAEVLTVWAPQRSWLNTVGNWGLSEEPPLGLCCWPNCFWSAYWAVTA